MNFFSLTWSLCKAGPTLHTVLELDPEVDAVEVPLQNFLPAEGDTTPVTLVGLDTLVDGAKVNTETLGPGEDLLATIHSAGVDHLQMSRLTVLVEVPIGGEGLGTILALEGLVIQLLGLLSHGLFSLLGQSNALSQWTTFR